MPIRKIITNKIFKYEKNFYFIFISPDIRIIRDGTGEY